MKIAITIGFLIIFMAGLVYFCTIDNDDETKDAPFLEYQDIYALPHKAWYYFIIQPYHRFIPNFFAPIRKIADTIADDEKLNIIGSISAFIGAIIYLLSGCACLVGYMALGPILFIFAIIFLICTAIGISLLVIVSTLVLDLAAFLFVKKSERDGYVRPSEMLKDICKPDKHRKEDKK